jgi:predicted nucleotide-binding protein
MQITTVESVLAGGLGRSKMIITYADATQKDSDLENPFSMVGINFKNIKENEDKLIKTLKEYTNAGWKVEHVTSLTLS